METWGRLNMDEIKEAVESLKSVLPLGDRYFVKAYYHEIKCLIDLAESYLKIEMPEKKDKLDVIADIVRTENAYKSQGYIEGYNQAIDDCKLALLKKLEGLPDVIENWQVSIQEYKPLNCGDDLTSLSNSIKQYLVGGKK